MNQLRKAKSRRHAVLPRKYIKVVVTYVLLFAIVFSNMSNPLLNVFAGQKKEEFRIHADELQRAAEEALEEGNIVEEPLDFYTKDSSLLKEYEEIVFIPMSSGLSGTCQTATMLSEDYDGKVVVVNNQRISVTMRQSVLDALKLSQKGYTATQIKEILERDKMESSVYITLETLKYLRKGGRITAAAAAVGTVLNIKPVLQLQGEKLDAFAKSRGKSSAKKIMIKAMKNDMETRFKEAYEQGKVHMQAAYTGNPEEAAEWAEVIKEEFPTLDFHMDPLSLSVACHIGYGSIAIACSKYIPECED